MPTILIADTPPKIVTQAIFPGILDATEATRTEIGDRHESIDLGPFDDVYVRLCAPDLVVVVDAARRLLDRIEEAVLDARHDRTLAERHLCPGCSTLLEPDENTCGSARCDHEWALDSSGLF